MRVLHVIGRLHFADGGPPVVASRLAAAQARAGHGVAMLCYSAGPADEQDARLLNAISGWDKVALHRLAPPGRVERVLGAAGGRRAIALAADADVLHLHNIWEPILPRAAAAARKLGKPYVVLPNGMLDPWSLAQSRTKKKIALAMGYRRMLD